MKKIITLIGCGRWGLNILRDLVLLGCTVIVIDPNLRARKLASQTGTITVFSDINTYFIENIQTDAYIIAANSKQHYSLLLQLKDHIQPVFVEKPMVLNLHQAKHIQSLMGTRVFVMHKWRYHPGIAAIKQLIQSKKLGEIQRISTIRYGLQFEYDIPGHLILLPHDLSIILELLDDIPKVKQVTPYLEKQELLGFKADFYANPDVSIDICSLNKNNLRREITATFNHGIAILSEKNYQHISLFNIEGRWIENIVLEEIQPLYKELQVFLSYLNGGTKPKSKIEDEIKIIKCTEELLHAAEMNINKAMTICSE